MAVGGNVVVYSGVDDRVPVLQAVHDLPAGTQVRADDLRIVEIGVDPSVRAVPADELGGVVGRHTRARVVAGSLVVEEVLQERPLVTPGSAVVAVEIAEGALPAGVRERSRVALVIVDEGAAPGPPVEGLVVGLPRDPQTVTGTVSLSVEVPSAVAASLAAASDVAVVLLAPVGVTDPGDEP